ncbi:N-acetylglucosaminyl-diphospho-decaprenol L-rhamnosyltransferase [Pseudobythopirellula maris]|uniref:N-acetylglucosaminyl-diphospho-decaprenol L-rhamnosyltransferase n=1 Tax=Pseudobythopirellula maris TaxID=2527991 RepID=A0A5C5ZM40_9BACT|nr:glycosyltransferase family 2 protein [Pseudobythopirellula maris]TWT87503.1 N-acetylglucosaminyl-diphospho-decaprenol L-rhamnosyltransferase [Pseudobythopirellula maris]
MHLLIVLVNYHGSRLTTDCLRSLKPELEALPEAHVALCENGSGDEETQRLREAINELGLAERVTLTAISPNRGFTGGNNAVIRPAMEGPTPPDAVFLLNNDTVVLPGAIQKLVAFMRQRPEVGLCGSRLEYPDGESQRAARRVLNAVNEFESRLRLGVASRALSPWVIAPPDREEPHECGWVPGAALLVRRNVIEKVGLLDEDLFTYFDDVDYCLRAKRAGWTTWYVPESRIVHLVGQTTGITDTVAKPKRVARYWFLARRHYFLKNFGVAHATVADAAAIAGQCLWRLRTRLTNRVDNDPPYMLSDLIRNSVFVTGFRIRPVPNPALADRLRPDTSPS